MSISAVPEAGKNTLAKMVKDICADAGIGGNKSNHSLRTTGATELYQAGVPEKVIQERTGHLSLTDLRQYECTSGQQHEAVSRVLAAKENVTYQQVFTFHHQASSALSDAKSIA